MLLCICSEPLLCMKQFIYLLLCFFLISCDDGDIIVTTFDFDDEALQLCGTPGSYVFYKINSKTSESISLQTNSGVELFLTSNTTIITLNGTTNYINYRTYDGEITSDYFCRNVPPTTPLVTTDYLGDSGTATMVVVVTLDDEDGLDEDPDSELDTDDDELLNYYDYDDDGDNVPTSLELGDDPENPRDFDGDGVPDYLDTDDDQDGILTRYEAGGGLDPASMITDATVGPDYLNPAISTEVVIDQYRTHTYTLSSDIVVTLQNVVLSDGNENITQETLDMGDIPNVLNIDVEVIPDFN